MELKNVACGAKLTADNGERFYMDWSFPGRTFISRVTPLGACEPAVVPIEPKDREGILQLFEAYIADHATCPNCGVIVDEPGFCDEVCHAS